MNNNIWQYPLKARGCRNINLQYNHVLIFMLISKSCKRWYKGIYKITQNYVIYFFTKIIDCVIMNLRLSNI